MTRTIEILLEIQDKKIRLWVHHELIKEWRHGQTTIAGAPLEAARQIEAAFSAANVAAVIVFGDGYEEFNEENKL